MFPRFYFWYPIDYSPSPLYCYLFRRSVWVKYQGWSWILFSLHFVHRHGHWSKNSTSTNRTVHELHMHWVVTSSCPIIVVCSFNVTEYSKIDDWRMHHAAVCLYICLLCLTLLNSALKWTKNLIDTLLK